MLQLFLHGKKIGVRDVLHIYVFHAAYILKEIQKKTLKLTNDETSMLEHSTSYYYVIFLSVLELDCRYQELQELLCDFMARMNPSLLEPEKLIMRG